MSGRRLLKRVLLVFGFATAACLFLAAVNADATPLRPDIRKLVAQPRDRVQFAPARAGWDGPETASGAASGLEPTAIDVTQTAAQRASRAAVLTAALPDPRAIVAIVAAILMLRVLRWRHEIERRRAAVIPMPAPALPPSGQKAA